MIGYYKNPVETLGCNPTWMAAKQKKKSKHLGQHSWVLCVNPNYNGRPHNHIPIEV